MLTMRVVSNKLPQAKGAGRRAFGVAARQMQGPLLSAIQAATPVWTGELRDSETVTATDEMLRATAGTDHGLYRHQGTRRMTGVPFLREPFERMAPQVGTTMGQALERELA